LPEVFQNGLAKNSHCQRSGTRSDSLVSKPARRNEEKLPCLGRIARPRGPSATNNIDHHRQPPDYGGPLNCGAPEEKIPPAARAPTDDTNFYGRRGPARSLPHRWTIQTEQNPTGGRGRFVSGHPAIVAFAALYVHQFPKRSSLRRQGNGDSRKVAAGRPKVTAVAAGFAGRKTPQN